MVVMLGRESCLFLSPFDSNIPTCLGGSDRIVTMWRRPFHCSKDQILCSICDDPYCRFMIFMSLSLLYLFNSICIHLAHWCVIKLGMNQTLLYITILVPYVVWMNIPLTSPIYDIIGCNYIGIHQCIFKCIIKYVTIHFTVILVEHPFTSFYHPKNGVHQGSQGVDPGPNRAPPRSARSGGIWTWRRAFVGPASRWIHRPNKGHKNP